MEKSRSGKRGPLSTIPRVTIPAEHAEAFAGLKSHVYYFDVVTKINKKNKRQQRVLVVTRSAVYTATLKGDFTRSKGDITRSIRISKVGSLQVKEKTGEIGVVVPGEYDLKIQTQEPSLLVHVLKAVVEWEKGKVLDIDYREELSLNLERPKGYRMEHIEEERTLADDIADPPRRPRSKPEQSLSRTQSQSTTSFKLPKKHRQSLVSCAEETYHPEKPAEAPAVLSQGPSSLPSAVLPQGPSSLPPTPVPSPDTYNAVPPASTVTVTAPGDAGGKKGWSIEPCPEDDDLLNVPGFGTDIIEDPTVLLPPYASVNPEQHSTIVVHRPCSDGGSQQGSIPPVQVQSAPVHPVPTALPNPYTPASAPCFPHTVTVHTAAPRHSCTPCSEPHAQPHPSHATAFSDSPAACTLPSALLVHAPLCDSALLEGHSIGQVHRMYAEEKDAPVSAGTTPTMHTPVDFPSEGSSTALGNERSEGEDTLHTCFTECRTVASALPTPSAGIANLTPRDVPPTGSMCSLQPANPPSTSDTPDHVRSALLADTRLEWGVSSPAGWTAAAEHRRAIDAERKAAKLLGELMDGVPPPKRLGLHRPVTTRRTISPPRPPPSVEPSPDLPVPVEAVCYLQLQRPEVEKLHDAVKRDVAGELQVPVQRVAIHGMRRDPCNPGATLLRLAFTRGTPGDVPAADLCSQFAQAVAKLPLSETQAALRALGVPQPPPQALHDTLQHHQNSVDNIRRQVVAAEQRAADLLSSMGYHHDHAPLSASYE